MLYLTFKFHDNSVHIFGFIEGAFEAPPPAQELKESPGGIGLVEKTFLLICLKQC